ncbi:MAG TPA: outer membrane lipid asymmetry maintenance protein MlaD [Oligoflexia bacterium]|nr:outer membrane lipid asymmetry maintenance protein MlaD [Oligoflexia bacterium]HMP26879.1 outer membrane lipid asymmetry maintenance protein MlaD [Oligoflexia bacterium]
MESKDKDQKSQEFKLSTRKFSTEFFVGLFAIISLAALSVLIVNLGGMRLSNTGRYKLFAEFDNVSGLKYGASVEIAGVQIGEVESIQLADPRAIVTLNLKRGILINDDDIASIRTKGIIGDRYIKVSRGASDKKIPEGGKIIETESVVDFEDIIGKFIHSFENKDKENNE